MFYFFSMRIPFFFAITLLCVTLGTGCQPGDTSKENSIDYEGDIKPLIEEKTEAFHSRGSCNAIDFGSHCIDYVGSMWTEEAMRLNCQGEGTLFSLNACPYSEIGGCDTTYGTITEIIAWAYNEGGDPITQEVLPYMQGSCTAVPGTRWVTPEMLLEEQGQTQERTSVWHGEIKDRLTKPVFFCSLDP